MPKLVELVDNKITCIDQGTMDLFKEIAKLTRALLADEDSTFSVYFA